MMNADYHFDRMRELLGEFESSRERSLAATKLDECEMWLGRCQRTQAAFNRDLVSPDPRPAASEPTSATGGVTPATASSLTDLGRFNPAGGGRQA